MNRYLTSYDADHLSRIALPLGGIGTGTISLGGRGDLRDWEIQNRPAKGFVPQGNQRGTFPSIVLRTQDGDGDSTTRLMEGPLEEWEFDGHSGSAVPNHGMPRFRSCSFDAGYPFGRVNLADPDVPVTATMEGFNPFIPGDADSSGLPVAVLRIGLQNTTDRQLDASVCLNVPNFVGDPTEKSQNSNTFYQDSSLSGIRMDPGGVSDRSEKWGTMAIATLSTESISHRTAWKNVGWGASLLDYWDEFSQTGEVTNREADGAPKPMASLCVRRTIPAGEQRSVVFLIAWHFPNRCTWTPSEESKECCSDGACACAAPDIIGNYYCTQFVDAWSVVEKVAAELESLEQKTLQFVDAFLSSDLPGAVKEGALFNLSTLRSQTVFRTPDGRLFGFEGCGDDNGCCFGSCTHVWNYETATPFLFGDLARSMREVEFMHATPADGRMSFRVSLPIERGLEFGKAAADGQLGTIMKCYREWQLSGDHETLRKMWPRVRATLEFCWIQGGWDGDRDGVMEGCQHNTMDVEYYGPNPQMQGWYLGALRAAEEMARYLEDDEFAESCRELFEHGRKWMEEHLFNGEYYIHQIRPLQPQQIADGLILGTPYTSGEPEYQLGEGCLVDQLVGQYMAHVTGLGYLHDPENIRTTLRSILKYNRKEGFHDHFNCMRSYALADETALLMAAYPGKRPTNPFPYFTEVMTGFEWTAAVGMLYEGMVEEGLSCISAIRRRYDGKRRNPYDEAECGHHYARAMASWSAVLALTGFHYSAVSGTMRFQAPDGTHFWSTGDAWGTCTIRGTAGDLQILHGRIEVNELIVNEPARD
jgi:uncharacterized protein (DUF608 family)